ncbi:MAG: 7TM diverse intracellular signaling domain-containing protein [Halarcobacter sp.]
MRFIFLILLYMINLSANSISIIESKYFLDKQHSYTTENIYKNKNKFTPYNYENATFGFKKDTIWLYFKVKNNTNIKQENLIEFLYRLHDYIYIMEYKDGQVIDQYLTGDLTKHNTRKIDSNDLLIPYTLDKNETKEFIFKINSDSNLSIGLNFLSKKQYYENSKQNSIALALYYGATLIMLFYNLFLFIMIKEKVYLYYVLFHLTFALALLTSNGISFTLFWPNFPQINSFFMPLIFSLTNIFSVLFAIDFLEIKKYSKKILYYLYFILLIHIILLLNIFIEGYSILETMLSFSLISVFSLFFIAIYTLIKYKTISSKFFVIAWSFLLFGSIIEELQGLGIIKMGPILSYSSQIGAFFELTLLSFALAYKYNIVFNKLQKTESNLRVLNANLQEKVDEKTKDLKLLIKEMHHRVKNNFQFILTFLWAQKNSTKDENSLKAINQTTQRIYAISSLHELLNISTTISIDIKSYIENMLNSFVEQDKNITYEKNIDNITLDYDKTVSIGLILNELITNSNKYAFKDISNPTIKILFYKKNDIYILDYCDNGIGFDKKILNNSLGLGFELIYGLAKKIHAEVNLDTKKGTRFEIKFK